MKRREVVKAGLVLVASATAASIFRPLGRAAKALTGGTKWPTKDTSPPQPAITDRLVFLTAGEASLVSAVFDRLIPADALSVSASQAGCVTFLDNQLAGSYGRGDWLYKAGPQRQGTPQQGNQTIPIAPAAIYRKGLAEMAAHCRVTKGKDFTALPVADQDRYLEAMEAGAFHYPSIASNRLFAQMLANVMEGFFADPIYGGNRDMVGWKMIGFPGSRYDYRSFVNLKGRKLDIEPVSIVGTI